ncbi:MAG: hypothetical protein RJA70_4481 [Pseudomonadota bacterium]
MAIRIGMVGVMGRVAVASSVLALVALFPLPASAGPSVADRAAAEALFDQALKLLDAGNPQAACPKLEESQRMDPGVGTLLYLADCYRAVGRTASAWATFLQASYEAKDAGQTDRQQIAEEQAQAMKSTLSKIVLRVTSPDSAGLIIRNDGQELGRPLWGSEVPVDPGEHTFEAKADGKKAWTRTVLVAQGPGVTEVQIPMLEDAPVAVAAPVREGTSATQPALQQPPATALDQDPRGSSQTTWAWVSIAAGGAALAGGGVFSVLAMSDNGRADEFCRKDAPSACGEQGVTLGKSAEKNAQIATLLSGAGGALAVTGVILLLTAPSDSDSALSLSPVVGNGEASVWLNGTF